MNEVHPSMYAPLSTRENIKRCEANVCGVKQMIKKNKQTSIPCRTARISIRYTPPPLFLFTRVRLYPVGFPRFFLSFFLLLLLILPVVF